MFTVPPLPLPTPLDPVQSALPHTFSVVYDSKDSNMKDAKLQGMAFAMFAHFLLSLIKYLRHSNQCSNVNVVTIFYLIRFRQP